MREQSTSRGSAAVRLGWTMGARWFNMHGLYEDELFCCFAVCLFGGSLAGDGLVDGMLFCGKSILRHDGTNYDDNSFTKDLHPGL
jgi:hypothetical protein